jgi:DNA-binding PadR family transcriptional regulator
MTLSVLDLFLLSMLDRGAQSPYELQRTAGVSQGASVPSLRRLLAAKLVTRKDGIAATNRPRHAFTLTAGGRKAVRTGWKSHFIADSTGSDLDSLLRIVDMAAHYGADKKQLKAFLKHAAEVRCLMADKADLAQRSTASLSKAAYLRMRAACDAVRLSAEGDALLSLSSSFGAKWPLDGQQSLL